MPASATHSKHHVVNANYVGERRNRTQIFVSDVNDMWFPGQTKGQSLILVSEIADGFRDTVTAQSSLNRKMDKTFHIFSLPEDCSVLTPV